MLLIALTTSPLAPLWPCVTKIKGNTSCLPKYYQSNTASWWTPSYFKRKQPVNSPVFRLSRSDPGIKEEKDGLASSIEATTTTTVLLLLLLPPGLCYSSTWNVKSFWNKTFANEVETQRWTTEMILTGKPGNPLVPGWPWKERAAILKPGGTCS